MENFLSAMFYKPMMALASMILYPRSYIPSTEIKKPELKITAMDLLVREEHFEFEAAAKIMREVLESLNCSSNNLLDILCKSGAAWFERGEEVKLSLCTNK